MQSHIRGHEDGSLMWQRAWNRAFGDVDQQSCQGPLILCAAVSRRELPCLRGLGSPVSVWLSLRCAGGCAWPAPGSERAASHGRPTQQ